MDTKTWLNLVVANSTLLMVSFKQVQQKQTGS